MVASTPTRAETTVGSITRIVPLLAIPKPQEVVMFKRMSIAVLTLLALLGAASLLTACHTTAGAGEDISNTGHAITNSANKNTP